MSQTQLSFRSGATQGPDDKGPPILSVTQVVRGANRLLEGKFSGIWVEGEVSNLNITGAGHAFFTLKDDIAALPVAMWRTSLERLKFRPEDGQFLRVYGRLGIFAKQGRFQLYADRAEPAGLGALMLELEQRKARLAAEGLFATDRKRALPRWPRIVGVVTSAHGAAIHDVLQVARRRCPTRFVLCAAVVQGPEAPRSVARALGRLCDWPQVDVIIVGRGGGSVEDLWAFNDERIARAVAACPVPVVSAVGHEVDVTICDLVADVRAATPSQAAELVVPDLQAITRTLDALSRRLARALERAALDERSRLDTATHRLRAAALRLVKPRRAQLADLVRSLQAQHPRARVARDRRRLTDLRSRLTARGNVLPISARLRLARAAAALDALSPLAVLQRGYAVASTEDGRVLRDAASTAVGDPVRIRLHSGSLRASVTDIEPEEP